MKNKENDPRYNAENKRIVDLAYIKRTLILRIILFSVLAVVLCTSLIGPVLIFVFKILPDITALRAVRADTFTVTEDFIKSKNVETQQDTDYETLRETTSYRYYVTTYRSGARRVSKRICRKYCPGELLWLITVPMKNGPRTAVAYYGGDYCIAQELQPHVDALPNEVRPTHVVRNISSTALLGGVLEGLAENRRARHAKATCPACGKTYKTFKHPYACPNCGAERAK